MIYLYLATVAMFHVLVARSGQCAARAHSWSGLHSNSPSVNAQGPEYSDVQ